MKKILAAIGILALTMNIGLTGCSSAATDGETVAVQSVSMIAGIGNVGLQNRFSGVVVAQATHSIMKDSERTVKKLKVAAGDEVKKGQILFTYDTDEIQMSIDMAELEIEKMENAIESTKHQIESLEKEKAKAKSSEQLSYSIEIQSLQADLKESEYNINTKKVEMERLAKTLKNAKVRSEASGVVQSINEKTEYDDYGNEKAYITIVETGSYRIKGVVNETNVSDIGMLEGSSVLIRSRVDAEQTWSGTLGAVDFENPEKNSNSYYYEDSDESSSSSKYPFYVNLDDSEGLMMGQHVYIELDQGQEDEQQGIWIPSYFLDGLEDSKAVVWAATGKDKLEKKTVKLGEYNEELDTYEILDGLTADDYIAIPDESLKNGLPVARYDEAYFEDSMEDGEGEYTDGEAMEGDTYEVDAEDGEVTNDEAVEVDTEEAAEE